MTVAAMKIDERRQHKRVDISFPMECRELPDRKYFYTVCKDLSLGGARILCEKFLAKNDQLKVTINFIDKVIDTKAKVAWCNKLRVSERYAAGLQFVEIAGQGKDDLSKLLNNLYPA